eukprot:m.198372 g.198372  ORF g.198372 m.198372 type:complete len:158 (+) comp32690_c3_seq3:443-916(+)
MLGDHLIKRGIPRPAVFSLGLAMMALAQICIMFGSTQMLYAACVIGGLAYGSFNALPPTLVSEMFGQAHFASIYAINSFAGAAASIGVASKMAGALYDEHATKDSDGAKICFGYKCYFTSALICAIACGFAMLIGLLLAYLTRKRYAILYADQIKKR